ncbi:hypothetical protein HF690_05550 [Oleiagrimonas citrea]|uniref:Uncharacterized protein n=1 Tax=Oleiagrimonas citrea TaxID=1665687 RepID=A0A846ZKU8_9GAMM|nr:hypothetical protein [Oleiagrimonas citrea]NKZ38422.1 hypothetical protein [Oleiagrimonas citrea]
MLFIWGRRVVRRKFGYVADFCPICRQARIFMLRDVRVYRHVYYIPVSAFEKLGYERTCMTCKQRLSGAPAEYTAVRRMPAHAASFIQTSFPRLRDIYAERLRIEDEVRRSPLSLANEMRLRLIREPFVLQSPFVDARRRRTSLDVYCLLALIAGAGLVTLTPIVSGMLHMYEEGPVFGVMALLALALIAWVFSTEPRRFTRRKLLPRIVQALRPLKPSESELTAVVKSMISEGIHVATYLRSSLVLKALAKPSHSRAWGSADLSRGRG